MFFVVKYAGDVFHLGDLAERGDVSRGAWGFLPGHLLGGGTIEIIFAIPGHSARYCKNSSIVSDPGSWQKAPCAP